MNKIFISVQVHMDVALLLPVTLELIRLASHVRCSSAPLQIDSQVLTVPDFNHPTSSLSKHLYLPSMTLS